MSNPEVSMTLHQAVQEVIQNLVGLDVEYAPGEPRYNVVVRNLNRALKANALENEWSYYSDVRSIGFVVAGQKSIRLSSTVRPRIIRDDAARLLRDGVPVEWAYFLPRDALHKYEGRQGLWCSSTRGAIDFSRPFTTGEAGLEVQIPVMREPMLFTVPVLGANPDTDPGLLQEVDFSNADLIVGRAMYYYAQSDPVMQPRVQTLEGDYKDLMYALIERDDSNTDSPYLNDFFVPVRGNLHEPATHGNHPHADDRRSW